MERTGKDIPGYAILSHTWGTDGEEITYKEFLEGQDKRKSGYCKITFCGKQAANDNLRYFWIDTCCIDKSSSAELSEAINSMFEWYHKAARCYVYLSDVSTADPRQIDRSFAHSRWFTRGWTLQELLAPTSMEFFSCEGASLGDRDSRLHQIIQVTGIPREALQGSRLSQFSADERMSWYGQRETKREEDAAYCLLGILNVSMPSIYGEGKGKAMYRLRKEIREVSQDGALLQFRFREQLHRDRGSIPFRENPRFGESGQRLRSTHNDTAGHEVQKGPGHMGLLEHLGSYDDMFKSRSTVGEAWERDGIARRDRISHTSKLQSQNDSESFQGEFTNKPHSSGKLSKNNHEATFPGPTAQGILGSFRQNDGFQDIGPLNDLEENFTLQLTEPRDHFIGIEFLLFFYLDLFRPLTLRRLNCEFRRASGQIS